MTRDTPVWLDWRDEIPFNTEFNDSYYSRYGGADEAQHVYIEGVALAEHARAGENFTLAELGFGTGLNFLSSVRAWQGVRRQNNIGKLHYIALEKSPLTRQELRRAWRKFPQIGDLTNRAAKLLAPLAPGFQRLWWSREIVLDLWVGDVDTILPYWRYAIDGWYLDGFAPSRNPQMFSDEVLNHVQRLSHARSRVASFTVAGRVRRGLEQRGFSVSKQPGFANKSHCLRARAQSLPGKISVDRQQIAVIGSGIAGSCVAQQLSFFAPTAQTTLIDVGNSASRVPLAAVSPRLSATNTPRGQLIVSALCYARQFYDVWSPSAWVGRAGAMKLPGPALDEQRLQRAVKTWAAWGARMCDANLASTRAGLTMAAPTQWLDQAGIIDTAILLSNLHNFVGERIPAKINRLQRSKSHAGWIVQGVIDQQGSSSAFRRETDTVVLACGAGSIELCPDIAPHARVKPGCVGFHPTSRPPQCALGGWGGHALRNADGTGFWYSLMRDQPGLPTALQQSGYPNIKPSRHWAGEKLSIDGHTPINDAVPGQQGVFLLAGAGGHGFSLMPMLATMLVSKLLGHVTGFPGDICGFGRK